MSPLTDMLLRTAALFAIAYFSVGFYVLYRNRKLSKQMTDQVTQATTDLTEAIDRELSSKAGMFISSLPSHEDSAVH